MRFLEKKIFLLSFFQLFWTVCFAETDYKYSYYEDKSDTFHITDIRKHDSEFISIPSSTLSLGFIGHSAWMKIDLPKTSMEQLLVIENAHLDQIDLYVYSDEKLLCTYSSGDLKSFSARTLHYNFFNFNIPATANQILIKTKNKGLLLVPVKILPFIIFFNYYQNYTLIHWFYFGFVILAAVSNLLFFLWLKESIYFYYVLCITAIGFVSAVDFGYTFQLLWPDAPWVNNYNTSLYCLSFFVVLFTEKILNIKHHFPKLYYVYLAVYFSFFVAVALSFMGFYVFTIQIIYYMVLVVPLLALSSGTALLIKVKSETSVFFLVGWSGYFISMFIYLASMNNLLPFNIFTTNVLQIGSSIEILFLNLAILSKINSLKKEKELILSEHNKTLESKVRARTLELSEKTDEILTQNEELQNQRTELEAQRDTLEAQNKIIEEQNILLKGSKTSLEKLVEKRTDELKHTNQELVEYNNRLEQFAFITAHNLRGPVSTLLGLSQIYNASEAADPINLIILEKSKETTIKLDEIIKDLVSILDLQKSVANLSHDINLCTLMNDLSILLSKEIEESNASIKHNFTPETTISSVSAYLNNIFYNLISNSIKFRKREVSPQISIEFIAKAEEVVFKFIDNGMGIDLTKQGDKIFHPYKRFHLDKEGKGLGLYIVKTQVEIMRGKITIESAEEKGTTITIVFPSNNFKV